MTTINYSMTKHTVSFSADLSSAEDILAALQAVGYDLQLREKAEEFVIPDGCVEILPAEGTKLMGNNVKSFHSKAWYQPHDDGTCTVFSYGVPILTTDVNGKVDYMHIRCIDVKVDEYTGKVSRKATKEWSVTTKNHVASFLGKTVAATRGVCEWAPYKPYDPTVYDC